MIGKLFGGIRETFRSLNSHKSTVAVARSITANRPCQKKKPYIRPQVIALSPEQSAVILAGRAWAGDHNARYMLELLFPDTPLSNSHRQS
jgi:hypothetical protein